REGREPLSAAGVPPLCPRLAALGERSRRQVEFRRVLLAAAAVVAHDGRVIDDSRFRIFLYAYVEGHDLVDIGRMVARTQAPAPRAIRERLRRLSHKIEEELIERMESRDDVLREQLDDALRNRVHIREGSRNDVTSGHAGLWKRVVRALGAIVAEGP
ncbi:MAG: hypothetical protein K8E66_10390, partial [Phycisphaerales bacterium]|nr:hypothetical protein [Phycisphaerales bacterium]